MPDHINEIIPEIIHLEETVAKLRVALADAIRRPIGVVPASAAELISQEEIDQAEERRIKFGPFKQFTPLTPPREAYYEPPQSSQRYVAQVTVTCLRCGASSPGVRYGSSDGLICERCHALASPYVPCETFSKFLTNSEDQVLTRFMIVAAIPAEIQARMLSEFNAIIKSKYEQRDERLGIERVS